MANNPPPAGAQFRPMPPGQPGQHFIPAHGQQFRPVGQAMPPGQHYSQPMQQLPPWQTQPPQSQGVPMQYAQPNRPPQNAPPYAYAPSSFQQNAPAGLPQYQQMSQMHAPVASVGPQQPWLSSGGHNIAPLPAPPTQPSGQQPSMPPTDPAVHTSSVSQQSASDWQEHTAADGRRYYYNKITKQSCWEKPFELMTPIERADASTVWKEFTTADGKKYYYNKDTKQSKWTIPDELRLAREQAEQAANQRSQPQKDATPHAPAAVAVTLSETSTANILVGSTTPSMVAGFTSSPFQVPSPTVFFGASAIPVSQSSTTTAVGVQSPVISMTPLGSGSTAVPTASVDAKTTSLGGGAGNMASEATASPNDGASIQETEEEEKASLVDGKSNTTPGEEKSHEDEPLVFATKLEAKNAFKSLLESANVQGDWTWEQTMREVSNDKRFGALRTPGERKQAFNEYLGQRKKLEAEERRIRQKKAREEFTKMLEESNELTSSMKWSKTMSLFEDDERYKTVERAREREDLYDSYIVELERKEKEKAAEEHRRNVAEFRKFIESCDFIKVSSQWRKVQDRLEDDERGLRLEKLDRLLIFQDYIRVLEREDEEQKKIQKEQLRRVERKNRDEFRKLMEEHVNAGTLTAKTHWLDYCSKVKDLPQYHAVATNMSGSTPKDLFEDVTEELETQFQDDKARIKDALKGANITVVPSWAFEDFKFAVPDEAGSAAIPDINLKLVYDELVERAKEKEEKEAKKRQRLADDFTKVLHTFKEITASSNWEDCRSLLEETEEYRSIDEENFKREIFEEYVAHLMEKAKEKERKREEKSKKEKEKEEKEKRKEREKKEEKEREREKGKERTKKDETDSENIETTDSHLHKEDKKREKDKDRKHRKRHQSASDDISSDKDEKEDSKKSRKHGSDRKKSRKHAYSPESDGETRPKKHKRDHRDGSRRNGGYGDLEDGELGEDGEIQ